MVGNDWLDNGFTERRRGLHELAVQIECLRVEFSEARSAVENRVTAIEVWRGRADPIVQMVVRTMWMVAGASLVLMSSTAVVVWIWLQDHSMLADVTRLSLATSTLVEQMQKVDARLERDVESLQNKHMRPEPGH
jgi:hypothetical protein